MPRVCWAPKIVSSLAHCIGRRPNITALLGRCLMEVPAYLDLTRTVRYLPAVPLPFPLSPPLLRRPPDVSIEVLQFGEECSRPRLHN